MHIARQMRAETTRLDRTTHRQGSFPKAQVALISTVLAAQGDAPRLLTVLTLQARAPSLSTLGRMEVSTGSGSTLLRGGIVYTMDPSQPWAQAVVVRGGVIAYVGPESGAAAFTDTATEVVDLAGGMCLPGFVDAHDHFATFAISKMGVNLSGIVGRDSIRAAILEYVRAQPAEAALRGYGWMPESFAEGGPHREWLDEVTGDRPMILFSADAHDLWFNTAAMRISGVGPRTPDPSPGTQYFKRDPDGTPSGWAVEGAQILITVPLGVYGREGIRASQDLTIGRAPGWGITTYLEAGAIVGSRSSESEPVYQDLIDRDLAGELPLRIVGTVWTRNATDDPSEVAGELVDWNGRLRSPHVQVSICKMWADGVMMSGGALLLQPLCNDPGNHGRLTIPPGQIEATVEAVQRAGFDMHVHVDADGSARAVLDAIAAVHRRLGRGDSRHAIAHNTMIDPVDLPRYAAMGVLANCTPLWGTDYNGQYIDIYTALIGPERMEERLFPYGDLVRSGAIVTYGADIPGVDVPEIAPLIQIESLLTRRRPGFPEDRPLVERQRIGLHDALRGYTINGAYQLRMEDMIGSIAVGKRADLVVVAENLFAVPAAEVHAVPVRLTMMDGQVTFRAS